MSFALSTSWNAFRLSRGRKIVKQIKDIGFNQIELSFTLDASMLKDIFDLSEKNAIEVVSLHNFCPIPDGLSREKALPDSYSLASKDERQRETAVFFTKKSIDSCCRFKAKALVIHSGRVEIEDETRSLIELYSNGKKASRQYGEIFAKMRRDRNKKADIYFSQALKSLKTLADYARQRGISIGVENRFYYREIPSFDELKIIFANLKDKPVFYWHDTGHAAVAENLGFVNSSDEYLAAYGKNIIGTHLHDVEGCRDHLAPLKGKLDFSKLKPYLKNTTLKVIEAHYPATSQEIIKGRDYLEKIFT